ncbi:MAG TPA: ABC transporter substrate-binding protein [Dehalococcoidia bacterium]|nr:ABC transporter substrate-binding protein [Dehalococcoidia bacterium]
MKSYWYKTAGRRRLLQSAAVLGGGALAAGIVGCGGGGDDSGGRDAGGLLSKPLDTTNKATRGGVYQYFVTTEAANFDGIAGNNAAVSAQAVFVYPFLVRNKMVKYPAAYAGEVEADAAESWEITADGLQYTFKLRPNGKLDPRPPTSGRPLDAADVKWSWDLFASKSSSRTILANSAAQDAPIQSVTTPDNRTVVMKLAFPYAPLLQMLAYSRHLPIMPREAEGGASGFDPRGEMRGSGAFRLEKYSRSLGYEYRRNPDWYDADKMYLDGVDIYIIPEYATGLAQFRSGNLWSYAVRAEDLLTMKRDIPQLLLMQEEAFTRATTPWVGFSNNPGQPFRDDRVRKAASMLIDRKLWVDTFYNVSPLAREGLNQAVRLNTHISSGEEGIWLDPEGRELGEGAKFFRYDPKEAKALLRAAGFNRTIESVFHYTPNGYSSTYVKQAEVLKGMLEAEGDFKFTFNTPDYSTEWLSTNPGKYHYGNGRYDGIAQGSANTYPEIDGHVQAYFHSKSIRVWHGYEDATLDSLIEQQRKELNRERRIELLKEFQRHTAKTMPSLIAPGAALGFANMAWPFVGNYLLWRGAGSGQQTYMYRWYDQSKRT